MSQQDNRKRSIVWNSFMVDSEDEWYVRCAICGARLYRGVSKSTTGMLRHLKLTHNTDSDDENDSSDTTGESRRKRARLDSSSSGLSINPVTVPRVAIKERANQIKLALTVLCGVEALPLDFVQSSSFHSFCSVSTADILSLLPSAEQIRDNLIILSERVKQNIIFDLEDNCIYCTLIFEIYQIKSQSSVLQISCSWLDNDLKSKTVILGAKVFIQTEGLTDLNTLIKSILYPYSCIMNKIVAIMTQGNELLIYSLNILSTENYLISHPAIIVCYADTINTCLKNIINKFKKEDPYFFITTLQTIISQFQMNLPLVNTWVNQLQKPELTVDASYSDSWIPIYKTLVIIDEQWTDFSDYIKNYIPDQLYHSFFNSEVRESIRDFLSLISPLIEIVNMTLSQINNPTIGYIYPYIRTCATFLLRENPTPEDGWTLPKTEFSIEVRKALQEQFAYTWSGTPSKTISLSCVLDPRYKQMIVFTENEKSQIHHDLVNEIENNRLKNSRTTGLKMNNNSSRETTGITSAFSVSKVFEEKLKSGDNIPNTNNKDANSIIQDYFTHDVEINDTLDTTNWWNTHRAKYMELIPSVRKYCCIPATAGPRDFVFETKQLPFYTKRDRLDEEILEYAVLIRSNLDYVDEDSEELDLI